MRRWPALLLMFLVVPGAAGQINSHQPFFADYGFADADEPEVVSILSGEMDVTIHETRSPFAFFGTRGLTITGLEQVCWGQPGQPGGGCLQDDGLRIRVHDGGAAGLQFPIDVSGTYEAAHALGLFMRFEGEDVNSLDLDQGLMAPSIDGTMAFDDIGRVGKVPLGAAAIPLPGANLVPASRDTVVDVLAANGNLVERLTGKQDILYFEGRPEIAPFSSDFPILPFEDLSFTRFRPAPVGAAAEGLDFERINQLFDALDESNRVQGEQGGSGNVTTGSGPIEQLLSEVLNGALLRFPQGANVTQAEVQREFTIVRFDALVVENQGGELAWTGRAAMQYREGEVKGAPDLVGFWFFQLPWWGYLLWIAAIGLIVARVVVQPPKHHALWDRFRWIGWASGGVIFLLVAFLWDLEMRTVWGTSVLTTSVSGTAFWVTLLVQFLTMGIVLGVVAAPLSIIIKNSLMLGGQGTFMRLGGPTAFLLAYLIGATLLLSYLELILDVMTGNASG